MSENPDILIGVAGSVTSITGIELQLTNYDPQSINGFLLQRNKIKDYITDFSAKDAAVIEKMYPQFLQGRGDLIVAGLLVLSACMDLLSVDTHRVSTGGVRMEYLLKN